MGSTVDDMQVGCLWMGEHLITVSLSGVINYLDRACPDKPQRIIKVCHHHFLLQPFPYLSLAYPVVILHVLRSCACLCTPVSFICFRITPQFSSRITTSSPVFSLFMAVLNVPGEFAQQCI